MTGERPLVSVKHPSVMSDTPDDPERASVEVPEALILTCSEHGELTDWCSLTARAHLQWKARKHADDEHDGDVDAAGWKR